MGGLGLGCSNSVFLPLFGFSIARPYTPLVRTLGSCFQTPRQAHFHEPFPCESQIVKSPRSLNLDLTSSLHKAPNKAEHPEYGSFHKILQAWQPLLRSTPKTRKNPLLPETLTQQPPNPKSPEPQVSKALLRGDPEMLRLIDELCSKYRARHIQAGQDSKALSPKP